MTPLCLLLFCLIFIFQIPGSISISIIAMRNSTLLDSWMDTMTRICWVDRLYHRTKVCLLLLWICNQKLILSISKFLVLKILCIYYKQIKSESTTWNGCLWIFLPYKNSEFPVCPIEISVIGVINEHIFISFLCISQFLLISLTSHQDPIPRTLAHSLS